MKTCVTRVEFPPATAEPQVTTATGDCNARQARPGGLLFAIFQNGSKANGGLESVTQIIEGLAGVPSAILTNSETAVTARWRRAGATTRVVSLPYAVGCSWRNGGPLAWLRRGFSLAATTWWVWRTVREQGVQEVHFNDPSPFWHVAIGARLAGVPLVLNLRDTKSREEGLDLAKYRRRFRLCQHVLVLSQEMKEFYAAAISGACKAKQPRIDYIYSVVDFKRMCVPSPGERSALRHELGIPDDEFAIGFVATFNDKKNQLEYLRQAVPQLQQMCPTARTWFVGDFEAATNRYAQHCADVVRELNIGVSVQFTGYESAVEKWYQACDVIVVPTRKEGLARCMIEGLACGTPIVSFDVCSASEILERYRCGVVVSQSDYHRLCTALVRLANSPALRSEYSANGAAAARRLFGAETSMAHYRGLVLREELP